jgi:hypothetical protein
MKFQSENISELRKAIRSIVQQQLREYGMESLYYSAPGGFEQMHTNNQKQVQRFDNLEKWKITAMQLGAVIQDRGDDWVAIISNQTKIGTFSKLNGNGTLTL